MSQLDVLANSQRIGTLSFAEDRFAFVYDSVWKDKPPVLLSPRLTPERCASAESHREISAFLANLLPEGTALDDVAMAARLSKSNLFGLIHHIGRETTGALTFQDPDSPTSSNTPIKRPLPYAELSERIRTRHEIPFSVWDRKVRLSLAGYQDKLAVFKEQMDLSLVDGSLASTHILKPAPKNPATRHLVINEFFCMRIAEVIKLPVADVEFIRVPEPVLLIHRFDRQLVKDTVQRRHIIDACQALGLSPAFKYECNFGHSEDVRHIRDGVSFKKLFGLRDMVHNKAATTLTFLRWAIFQYLIGNTDAHGKNFSFYVDGRVLKPAPAYDLVCVAVHPEFEQSIAMAIGDSFDHDTVSAYDWAMLATECGIKHTLMAKEMHGMAEKITRANKLPKGIDFLAEEVSYLETIQALIEERAVNLREASALVPELAEL